MERYWFAKDDNWQWYLLPTSVTTQEWGDWVYCGGYDEDRHRYDDYKIDVEPHHYTFTDPEMRE